jgi:hypothetical protein
MTTRTIFMAVLLAPSAFAGPPLTTIQDVIYRANGTRFNGTLAIAWSSFQAADTSAIATQNISVKVVDGNLRVKLVPTTGSIPPTVYSVTYNSGGSVQFYEIWAVPTSARPIRLSDVRVAASTVLTAAPTLRAAAPTVRAAAFTVTSSSATDSIDESDVVGLTADLTARPIKGPGYAINSVAIVNATGGLESATGNVADCVHVDGSSGPCSSTLSFFDGDSPSGTLDGVNSQFTLSTVPNPASSLAVFRNGLLQKIGQDYTLNGQTLVFVSGATPQPGDTLLASYRF